MCTIMYRFSNELSLIIGFTQELLEMGDKCILWQSDSLVNLRGIVLGNPQALVLDWIPLGSLDIYLKENCLHVESVELIEAASHIAKALWFLVRFYYFT